MRTSERANLVFSWATAISQREAKGLIRNLSYTDSMDTRCKLASKISQIRQSPQAQEGLAAFFEKREPNWEDL